MKTKLPSNFLQSHILSVTFKPAYRPCHRDPPVASVANTIIVAVNLKTDNSNGRVSVNLKAVIIHHWWNFEACFRKQRHCLRMNIVCLRHCPLMRRMLTQLVVDHKGSSKNARRPFSMDSNCSEHGRVPSSCSSELPYPYMISRCMGQCPFAVSFFFPALDLAFGFTTGTPPSSRRTSFPADSSQMTESSILFLNVLQPSCLSPFRLHFEEFPLFELHLSPSDIPN